MVNTVRMNDVRNRLLALLEGRADRVPVRSEAPGVAGDETTVVLRLYDVIDSWGERWGVSAKEFAAVLDDLPDTVENIRLHINSPGGEVFEAVAVLNLLRNHPAKVTAVVDGLAASSASFVAVGVDELVMGENSELMIHSPWAIAIGDAQDHRDMADLLDSTESNIASIYAKKAGGTIADWRAAMHKEVWFSADEAVEAGLADSVAGGGSTSGSAGGGGGEGVQDRYDRFRALFNFSGRADAPVPTIPSGDPPGGPTPTPGGAAVAFSDEQITDLRSKLGVADDADEATILAALDGVLEQATAPDPEPGSTATLPEGVVAIDETQLAELKADAAAGREARAEQVKAHREALVAAAVKDGRVPPARAEAWIAQLEADPGAEAVLAKLEPGLVPVDQIGAAGQVDLDSDDAVMAALFAQEVKA